MSPTPADFGKGVKAKANAYPTNVCLEGKLKPGSTALVRKGFDVVLAVGETVATVYPDAAKASAALSAVATSKLGPCFVAESQKHATGGEKFRSFTSSKLPLGPVGDRSSAYRVVVKFKSGHAHLRLRVRPAQARRGRAGARERHRQAGHLGGAPPPQARGVARPLTGRTCTESG